MASKATFTQAGLASIHGKQGRRLVVRDPKTQGLFAELRAGGAVTFFVHGRIKHGKLVRYRIGSFPAITVDDARTQAKDVLNAMARGVDPNDEERQQAAEPTFGELFELMMSLPPKKGRKRTGGERRQRTVDEYIRLRDKFLAKWLKRRASSITTTDVERLKTQIGKDSGKYQANRVLAIVVATFNAGVERKQIRDNPAAEITGFKEESRQRYLTPDEMPRFFAALEAEPELLADFFRLALLTGARRSNVQSMAWRNIDLTHAVWQIPGALSKNGSPLAVILAPDAVAVLQRRREQTQGSEFVFPSRGAAGHLTEPKTAWKRVCQRAGLKDVRIHDLRRSLGSWMALGNASLLIVGAALGQRSQATTEAYARLPSEPVRAAVNSATSAMMAAGKPVETT